MYPKNYFSFSSIMNVLDKISYGINFANKLIPMYNKVKPFLNNTKKYLQTIEINNTNDNSVKNNNIIKKTLDYESKSSNLTFFQ